MRSSQKLRIAIVGGGIGGLTMAVAFSHMNLEESIQVNVYESAAKLTQVGAGIGLWPRGWEIWKSMGLEEALAARFPPGQDCLGTDKPKLSFAMRKSDQHKGVPILDLMIPGGGIKAFHRAEVQEVLLNHISSNIQCHLNHRLSTYRQTEGGVEIEFKNGETTTCDILIGADGINSAVRKVFLSGGKNLSKEEVATDAQPLWTGSVVYRDLIDSELVRKDFPNHRGLTTPVVYCGKNKHLVVYPILQGKLLNVAPFVTDLEKEGTNLNGPAVIEKSADNIAPHFADWEEEVQVIIKHMTKPSRWAIQTVKPLNTYVSGRVFLMGDAAHAMAPHLGNGAGQAIEDAYILSNIIGKAARQGQIDIQKLGKIYDATRQPFGNFAVAASRNQGLLYEFNAPGFKDIKEGDTVSDDKLVELGKFIEKGYEWTYQFANDDLQRALSML
ncbi:hypothetical protein GALMADRAFT_221903 [Galerina marginata CBS 339.88]|uniref:FAD-binding domain-containing protein n=1 Tax=Galerina marginata (strain CBS 339.88) TaxID=685588 RepID=A0A067TQ46_GALM3|nr:hypothetical protein GALMADRAFT_221903 [Galerina marginata CBS 339.88]